MDFTVESYKRSDNVCQHTNDAYLCVCVCLQTKSQRTHKNSNNHFVERERTLFPRTPKKRATDVVAVSLSCNLPLAILFTCFFIKTLSASRGLSSVFRCWQIERNRIQTEYDYHWKWLLLLLLLLGFCVFQALFLEHMYQRHSQQDTPVQHTIGICSKCMRFRFHTHTASVSLFLCRCRFVNCFGRYCVHILVRQPFRSINKAQYIWQRATTNKRHKNTNFRETWKPIKRWQIQREREKKIQFPPRFMKTIIQALFYTDANRYSFTLVARAFFVRSIDSFPSVVIISIRTAAQINPCSYINTLMTQLHEVFCCSLILFFLFDFFLLTFFLLPFRLWTFSTF